MFDSLMSGVNRLVMDGLCNTDEPLGGFYTDEVYWNSGEPEREVLDTVIRGLDIRCIFFSRPSDPYRLIIEHLALSAIHNNLPVIPDDDPLSHYLAGGLHVVERYHAGDFIRKLNKSMAIVLPDGGVVTCGKDSFGQAIGCFRAVCFLCYVRLMSYFFLNADGSPEIENDPWPVIKSALSHYERFLTGFPPVPDICFGYENNEDAILRAGRHLADSGFAEIPGSVISARCGDSFLVVRPGIAADTCCNEIERYSLSDSDESIRDEEIQIHRKAYLDSGCDFIIRCFPRFFTVFSLDPRFGASAFDTGGENSTVCTGFNCVYKDRATARELPYNFSLDRRGLLVTGWSDYSEAFREIAGIEKMLLGEYRGITGI